MDEFVEAVLARYPLTNSALSHVADSFNTIYRISADEGEFVLRLSPPQDVHHPHVTEAEDCWTLSIRRAGLPAPRIIRTIDGSVMATVPSGTGPRAVLLTWTAGAKLSKPLALHHVESLGALSAQMHRASPPTATRPTGTLDASNPILFAVPDVLDTAPRTHRALFRERYGQAREWLRDLAKAVSEVPRVMHFDLTPSNVVLRPDGTLAPIDFQDLAWGHRAQDVANTLYGITGGVIDDDAVENFRRGYERHAGWPDVDATLLRRLFVARRIAMINLALTLHRPGLDAYLDRHAEALAAEAVTPPASGHR